MCSWIGKEKAFRAAVVHQGLSMALWLISAEGDP